MFGHKALNQLTYGDDDVLDTMRKALESKENTNGNVTQKAKVTR
ncbi:hypothetical protein ACWD04_32935 [Streptomyces sp. NPDC002911]